MKRLRHEPWTRLDLWNAIFVVGAILALWLGRGLF